MAHLVGHANSSGGRIDNDFLTIEIIDDIGHFSLKVFLHFFKKVDFNLTNPLPGYIKPVGNIL